MSKTLRKVIGGVVVLLSIAIVVWTAVVLSKDHSEETFKDAPGKIPLINTIIGIVAFFTAISNIARLLFWRSTGPLNLGVSCVLLVCTAAAFTALAYQWFHDISSDERTFYKDHKEKFYRLTLGQVVYGCLYVLLVLAQLVGSMIHCCHCSECCQSDEYSLDDDEGSVIYA